MIAPRISDHALLRWLERAHGVDVEGFRRMMAEEVALSMQAEGLRRVRHGPAFVVSADGECIVTFLSEGQQLSPFHNGIAVACHFEAVEQDAAA